MELKTRIQICKRLAADSIDLSDLGLVEIPEELKELENLKTINLSNNYIKEIPDWFKNRAFKLNINLDNNPVNKNF